MHTARKLVSREMIELRLLTARTERYLQLLKDNRVKGYLGEQQNYYDKQQ